MAEGRPAVTQTPKDDLTAAQHEVQRLFGDCLLRLQPYEMRLKHLLSEVNFRLTRTGPGQANIDWPADLHRKSLGMLEGDLMTSLFMVDGQPSDDGAPQEDEPDGPSFAFRLRIALPETELRQTSADISELVALRNHLVHHFLEGHDPRTLDGCIKAQTTLAQALERVAKASAALSALIKDVQKIKGEMGAYMASPEGQALFVHDLLPWHRLTITQALTEAAEACKIDGWASVSEAVAWIKAHHPDEDPAAYGCQSWRQVIHETQHFDLRNQVLDGKGQRFYRIRGET